MNKKSKSVREEKEPIGLLQEQKGKEKAKIWDLEYEAFILRNGSNRNSRSNLE